MKAFVLKGILVGLIAAGMLSGCSTVSEDNTAAPNVEIENVKSETPESETAKPETTKSESIGLTINGYYVSLNPTENNIWIEPMSMAADAPNDFTFSEFSGYSISVNGVPAESNQNLEVLAPAAGLRKSEGIEIAITDLETQATVIQYVRCLNQGFPNFITVSDGAEDGFYYFEPTLDWLCKMDTNSNIIYYQYCQDDFEDFRPYETEDGILYYGYKTPNFNEDERAICTGASLNEHKQVLMDKNYRIVKEIPGIIDADGNYTDTALDSHDFYFFDLDHYITLSYVPKYVYNVPAEFSKRDGFPARVMAAVIQEVKDGKIVFEWDSTNYPEFYEMSVEGNAFDMTGEAWCDYVHVNSMDICPNDENIIISMRNTDSVVEINRKNGDIEWVLGGRMDQFQLRDEQKTSRQHYARYTEEGTITVFDNSTNYSSFKSANGYEGNGTGFPRVVEYKLDEKNKRLLDFKAYEYKMPQSEVMGSAQKLADGQFVIGWGGSFQEPSKALFSEIDFKSKRVLFEASMKTGDNMLYRVFKYNK